MICSNKHYYSVATISTRRTLPLKEEQNCSDPWHQRTISFNFSLLSFIPWRCQHFEWICTFYVKCLELNWKMTQFNLNCSKNIHIIASFHFKWMCIKHKLPRKLVQSMFVITSIYHKIWLKYSIDANLTFRLKSFQLPFSFEFERLQYFNGIDFSYNIASKYSTER